MVILKSDTSHHTASFVVLEPDTVDRNGDSISADEIVKTAHEFVLNLQKKAINFNHEDGTDTAEVKVVESWIAPAIVETDGGEIKAGSWIVALKFFSDDLWDSFLAGEFTGVSMEGYWILP